MTTPRAARTDEDGNRRYPIPHPDTGEVVDLPNISSILDVLQAWGLTDWKLRMAGVGVAMSSDIAASVVAHHHDPAGPPRNRALKAVLEDAIAVGQRLEPGRGYLANDFGSAIHLLTEHIDAGVVDITNLPTTVAEHAGHYIELMAGHGIEIVHSEATIYNHTVGYAGTGDRIIRFGPHSPHLRIPEGFDHLELGRGCFWLDLKTGSVHAKFAMQLAALANAEGIYNADTGKAEPLPADLRTDIGFALHLTANGAALIPIELGAAWPAFVGALDVKKFCDTSPLGQPLVAPSVTGVDATATSVTEGSGGPAAPAPSPDPVVGVGAPGASFPDPERSAAPTAGPVHISTPLEESKVLIKRRWLIDRISKLTDAGKVQAANFWNARIPNVPTFKASDQHTMAELEQIEQIINDAERETTAPFPEPDPSKAEERVATNDPRRLDLIARLRALPPDLLVPIEASNREHKVPRLTDTAAYLKPSHLDLVEGWVGEAEVLHAPRAAAIADLLVLFEEKVIPTWDVLQLVGVDEARKLTDTHVQLLSDVVDALGLEVISHQVDGWFVHQPAVLDLFGNKRDLVAAGKAAAERHGFPKPTKADEVLANPALVAAISMTATATTAAVA